MSNVRDTNELLPECMKTYFVTLNLTRYSSPFNSVLYSQSSPPLQSAMPLTPIWISEGYFGEGIYPAISQIESALTCWRGICVATLSGQGSQYEARGGVI